MEKICIDILEQWAEYVNYDEDQKQFNLANFSYEINGINQTNQGIHLISYQVIDMDSARF